MNLLEFKILFAKKTAFDAVGRRTAFNFAGIP